MKPRVLNLPYVVATSNQEAVTIKIVVDADNYDYLRTTLTPMEALNLGNDLVTDALRAMRAVERRHYMDNLQLKGQEDAFNSTGGE